MSENKKRTRRWVFTLNNPKGEINEFIESLTGSVATRYLVATLPVRLSINSFISPFGLFNVKTHLLVLFLFSLISFAPFP